LNSRNDIKWRELLQPAFLICVAVLLAAAGGLSVTGRRQVQKEPLPLRKPLPEMNEEAIAPYRVIDKGKTLSADVIKALGTEEYIQWMLEDTSVPADNPCRFSSLFVTYYTGTPDAVPHIPDECYLGGGSQAKGSYDVITPINWLNTEHVQASEDIPVKCAAFSGKGGQVWESEGVFLVMYTFKVNGAYKGSRDATRLALGTNRSKYSYYAKVEWRFFGMGGIGGSRVYPSREEAAEGSKKFLSVVLGELERSHWPDWKDALARSGEDSGGTGEEKDSSE
jgi:hypothetical protein